MLVSFLLRLIGAIICVFGSIGGLTSAEWLESIILTGSSLISGLLLLGFAEVIESLKKIEKKIIGTTTTDKDVYDAINNAIDYKFNSKSMLNQTNTSRYLKLMDSIT